MLLVRTYVAEPPAGPVVVRGLDGERGCRGRNRIGFPCGDRFAHAGEKPATVRVELGGGLQHAQTSSDPVTPAGKLEVGEALCAIGEPTPLLLPKFSYTHECECALDQAAERARVISPGCVKASLPVVLVERYEIQQGTEFGVLIFMQQRGGETEAVLGWGQRDRAEGLHGGCVDAVPALRRGERNDGGQAFGDCGGIAAMPVDELLPGAGQHLGPAGHGCRFQAIAGVEVVHVPERIEVVDRHGDVQPIGRRGDPAKRRPGIRVADRHRPHRVVARCPADTHRSVDGQCRLAQAG